MAAPALHPAFGELSPINSLQLQQLLAAAGAGKRQKVEGAAPGAGATPTSRLQGAPASSHQLPQLPALAPQLGLPLPPYPPLSLGLPASGMPLPNGGAATFLPAMAVPAVAAAQQPPSVLAPLAAAAVQQQQQHHVGTGSGASHSHSQDESDCGEGHSGQAQAHKGDGGGRRLARRSSEERLKATKEKNRTAQQRFRLRQKEKMRWLEAEVARLRQLCTQHNIDPSPDAPQPVVPRTAAAAVQPEQASGPSTEQTSIQMYESLESMLERCPTVPSHTAIAYLTAFQRADLDTMRCQMRSLRRRFEAANHADVLACILCFLSGGGAGAAAEVQQA